MDEERFTPTVLSLTLSPGQDLVFYTVERYHILSRNTTKVTSHLETEQYINPVYQPYSAESCECARVCACVCAHMCVLRLCVCVRG